MPGGDARERSAHRGHTVHHRHTPAQMMSMDVALTARFDPKSRARMCIVIAMRKYATRASDVMKARYGITSPPTKPTAAKPFTHGNSTHKRRGKPTSSRQPRTKGTGPTHRPASTAWMMARATTGHHGSGVIGTWAPFPPTIDDQCGYARHTGRRPMGRAVTARGPNDTVPYRKTATGRAGSIDRRVRRCVLVDALARQGSEQQRCERRKLTARQALGVEMQDRSEPTCVSRSLLVRSRPKP